MRLLLILLMCSPGLYASDIGVASPSSDGGWLLLEEPPGKAGAGLSRYAGDPGLPVPDATGWPWLGGPTGGYPATELWHYDAATASYTRMTHVLGQGDRPATRRTLNGVFEINGVPHVLHYDPLQTLGGFTQILRAPGLAAAGGVVPADAILLNSKEYLDAPSVSPDRRHVAVRAFVPRTEGGGFDVLIRVFRVSDWTLAASSPALSAGRPVWLDNQSLALISWHGGIPPRPPQPAPGGTRVNESHPHVEGTLVRITLPPEGNVQLAVEELLKGHFPPDRLTQTVLSDPFGLGIVLARQGGDGVVVESREPRAGGASRTIATFERFRGMSVSLRAVRCMGVRVVDGMPTLVSAVQQRWGKVQVGRAVVPMPVGTEQRVHEFTERSLSADPNGGMIDLGRGLFGLLEPVANPGYVPGQTQWHSQPMLRHALLVPRWPGCDSLRNPRVVTKYSAMLRSFESVSQRLGGHIPSTLLIYDVEISDGANTKKGRFIELYDRNRRDGNGAIRTEDNLSGDWLVQAIDQEGGVDHYYDCADISTGNMRKRRATDVGKAYDDLVSQLQTRRLLMLTGTVRDRESGGLHFQGRVAYTDPHSGQWRRAWVFTRLGAYMDAARAAGLEQAIQELSSKINAGDGDDRTVQELALRRAELASLPRERLELFIMADLPGGSAGVWSAPHAPARARMRFTLAGNREAATDLAFEPTRVAELPDLGGGGGPVLLLPAEFRVFETSEGKATQRLIARAVQPPRGQDHITHERALVRDGRIQAGYDVPGIFSPRAFSQVQR